MAWSIFSDGGGQEVAVGWAQQLLKLIGAPVTPGNTQFVYDWETAEGGGGKFNPLNQGPVPGQPNLTTTGEQYGGGAADFASWQAGLMGAAAYLDMPNFTGIRDALRRDDPVSARAALIASPWAASHYGGGSSFPDTPLPGGQPVLPPLSGTDATLTAASGDPTLGGTCVGTTFPHTSWCLKKTGLRHLTGGALMVAGGLIVLPGVLLLAAFAFRVSGAQRAAGQTARALGPVAREGTAFGRYLGGQQGTEEEQITAEETTRARRAQIRATARQQARQRYPAPPRPRARRRPAGP